MYNAANMPITYALRPSYLSHPQGVDFPQSSSMLHPYPWAPGCLSKKKSRSPEKWTAPTLLGGGGV